MEIDLRSLNQFAELDLDQYFGLWAVEGDRFLALLERVGSMDLVAHVRANSGRGEQLAAARTATRSSGSTSIAVVEISGTMTKRGSSLSGAGSTVMLRQAIRQAASDESVGGILLKIESPGGTVAGTADLAKEVAAARQRKPVMTYVEDMAASAAYWIASQTERIYANDRTAMVGSIGTFVGLYDLSGRAAKEGIRPVVIRTGKYKGAGFPGTQITEEQQANWQELVDKTQAEFSAAVAKGRSLALTRVEELADGRVHLAADAEQLGLIDGIKSFEDTLAELAELAMQRQSNQRSDRSMSSANPHPSGTIQAAVLETVALRPAAASFEDLKAACPGADAGFLVGQLERKATVEEARLAFIQALSQRAQAAEAAAKAKDEELRSKAVRHGVEPLGNGNPKAGDDAAGDAEAAWHAAVDAKMARGMKRDRAIRVVVHDEPELHRAYLEAVNAGRR